MVGQVKGIDLDVSRKIMPFVEELRKEDNERESARKISI